MKRVVVIGVLVGSLALAAAVAQARYLPAGTAFRVASRDAQYAQHHTENAHESGVEHCQRRSAARVDCRVWISGGRFWKYVGGSALYSHFTLWWTVVVRTPGRRPLRWGEIDRQNQTWVDTSPTP